MLRILADAWCGLDNWQLNYKERHSLCHKKGAGTISKVYYTYDIDCDNMIEENANIFTGETLPVSDNIESWIEAEPAGDAWVKFHGDIDNITDFIDIPVSIRKPGTHPGGLAY